MTAPQPSAVGVGALPVTAPPTVELRRVSGLDRSRRGWLHDATVELGAGVHVALGTARDGAAALAALVCGEVAPRHGRVLVGGAEPARRAGARRGIAALRREPCLLPGTVRAAVRLALSVSGGAPDACLAALGPLARREVRALSRAERRRVELEIALAHPAPVLLLLEEPFCDLEPADAPRLRSVARERARAGACVLVVGGGGSDAAGLADRVLVLERGRLVASQPNAALERLVAPELEVWVRSGGRALVAALAAEAEVDTLTWAERPPGGALVSLGARDADAAAAALARAVAVSGAELVGFAERQPARDRLVAALWAPPPPRPPRTAQVSPTGAPSPPPPAPEEPTP
ncbi:MAG: hypothetical protein IT373_03965 [Polyangiaceae bacterium]|nr:hypothetical protein [Polyangiaceae bacterium]